MTAVTTNGVRGPVHEAIASGVSHARPAIPTCPRPPGTSTPGRILSAGLALVGLGALSVVASGSVSASARLGGHPRPIAGNVVANLFEWNWPSVAKECTDVLGPTGYGGVQVAPPQDSLSSDQLGDGSDTVLHPWWEVYQPVDYNLTSRMGNEAAVQGHGRRPAATPGSRSIVDAVINHMTGQGDTSYGGVQLHQVRLPGPLRRQPTSTSTAPGPTTARRRRRRHRRLQQLHAGLQVRAGRRWPTCAPRPTRSADKIAGYLNKLIGYGVSGFRVDAAKHIGQADLTAIYDRLHRTVDGNRPSWRSRCSPAARDGSHRRPSRQSAPCSGFDCAEPDPERRSRATRTPPRRQHRRPARSSARTPG